MPTPEIPHTPRPIKRRVALWVFPPTPTRSLASPCCCPSPMLLNKGHPLQYCPLPFRSLSVVAGAAPDGTVKLRHLSEAAAHYYFLCTEDSLSGFCPYHAGVLYRTRQN